MGSQVEKMAKTKNFGREKFFLSESIQNGLKRILKRKSRFRKFFLIVTCLSHFFEKLGHRSKKWQKQKFLVEKKLFWSESIQKGPKRILKRKPRFRKVFPIVT